MVVSKTNSEYSLLYTIKLIDKSILYDFALDYIKNNPFVSSKKLGDCFMREFYNLHMKSKDFLRIKSLLHRKFGFTLGQLLRENKVSVFNTRIYKSIIKKPKDIIDNNKLVFDGITFKNPRLGF